MRYKKSKEDLKEVSDDPFYRVFKMSPKAREKKLTPYTPRNKEYDEVKTPKLGYNLALLGLSNLEIATALGVASITVDKWMKNYPEFEYAVERGREIADTKVVRALYKRACGYTYEDTHVSVIKPKNPEDEPIVLTTPVLKHMPPDTQAAIFWLTNRQRKHWSTTQKIELNAKIQQTAPDLSDLTDDELALISKLGLSGLERNDNVLPPSTN